MKRKYKKTLNKIFKNPTSANVSWKKIESLLRNLGAEIEERDGSRISVLLFGQVQVFHRPHPDNATDKGAVVSVKKWLKENGVEP